MKTTVDVPEELYLRAEAEEGLRLVLEAPRKTRRQPSLAELTKCACGTAPVGAPNASRNSTRLY